MNEYHADKLNVNKVNINKRNINEKNVTMRYMAMIGIIFTMMIMLSSCAKVAMPEELISGVEEKSNYSEIIELLAAEEKIITIAVDQEESSFREINLLGDDDKEVVVLTKYKNSLDESDTYYELQIYKYKNDRWNKLTTATVGLVERGKVGLYQLWNLWILQQMDIQRYL